MPEFDPGVRRVSVHSGTAVVDVALPSAVPVGILIPSIVDILRDSGPGDPDSAATRRRLSRVGGSSLDPSSTLAENEIHDGTVLVLNQSATPSPVVRCDDAAEAVLATLEARTETQRDTTRLTAAVAAGCLTIVGALALIREALNGNTSTSFGVAATLVAIALLGAAVAHRAYREPIAGLTVGTMAVVFAAVAGFVVVPGPPGLPHALLAATSASAASVLAMRISGCGAVTFTAMSGSSLIVAVAAFAGTVTAAPLRAVGAMAALASIALIGAAARASIALAGLSAAERDDAGPDPARLAARAMRADDWLTGMLTALASSAVIGAVTTVLAGSPRWCCIGFGDLCAALLLMRSRSCGGRRTMVFGISGAVTVGVVAARTPTHGPWIAAATALLALGAIFLGFGMTLPPVARRIVELAERLALLALVPLACWVSGLYESVRGSSFG